MNIKFDLQRIFRACGPWLAAVLIPLLLNFILWRTIVIPQQAKLSTWRTTQILTKLQPKFTALLSEAHQALAEWRRTSFASDDPSAVMPAIQRLAANHHVEVKQLNVSGATTAQVEHGMFAAGKKVPVEVEAIGRFGLLARWLSDIERQSGFQIDSWDLLAPANALDQSCRLTVKMTAILGGA